jgi:hypothetical protein
MEAVVDGQIDRLGGRASTGGEGAGELALTGDEREDAAVVVGIGVDVEQARGLERGGQAGDQIRVATGADVGNGKQHDG